jgi:hypothetical protein
MTLAVLKESKTAAGGGQLNPSLTMLKRLNDAGLLEAYILISRSDPGIRQDYAAFRKNNRDKLKRYLAEYVIRALIGKKNKVRGCIRFGCSLSLYFSYFCLFISLPFAAFSHPSSPSGKRMRP